MSSKGHVGLGGFIGVERVDGFSGGIFSLKDQAVLIADSKWPTAIKASGGAITIVSGYVYHTFNSSGTFSPLQNISNADFLVVAGGGGSGYYGAGGAGGYRQSVAGYLSGRNSPAESQISFTAGTNYTIAVGAAGAATTGYGILGSQGGASSISQPGLTLISSTGGGGGGGGNNALSGGSGGSGGGAGSSWTASGSGGAGVAGQGFNGGAASAVFGVDHGGGGGGAGAAGGSTSGNNAGSGGNGLQWVDGVYRAGGGGGGTQSGTQGTHGLGSGINTGGGGNGLQWTAQVSSDSGVVIIRYAA